MKIKDLPIDQQRRVKLYAEKNNDYDGEGCVTTYVKQRVLSDRLNIITDNNIITFEMGAVPVTTFDLVDSTGLVKRLYSESDIEISDFEKIRIIAHVVEGFNVQLSDTDLGIKDKFTPIKLTNKEVFAVHLTENISLIYNENNNGLLRSIWERVENLPILIEDNQEVAIDNWSKDITNFLKDEVAKAESKLIETRNALLDQQRVYGKLKLTDNIIQAGGKKFVIDSIERTAKIHEVEKIKVCSNSIIVTTKPLCSDVIVGYKTYPSKYMGQWEILISSDLKLIKIRNIAAPSKDFQSCHVGNSACLGGFHDAIGISLQNFNLEGIVMNCVEFLRNFTPTDSSGVSRFEKVPNTTNPPKRPHVFKEWVKLIGIKVYEL